MRAGLSPQPAGRVSADAAAVGCFGYLARTFDCERQPLANVNMVRNDLLDILRCPENHATLVPADNALVAEVNALIRAGRLRNKAGRDVHQLIDGGLVRADGDLLYPIVDQIPVLLQDEAIPLGQLDT